MAVDAAALLTYSAIGNREDLTDMIYRVTPTECPFITAADREKATGVLHEWQTQELPAVNSVNSVLEGDDATTDTATPTVRLGNVCQISDKVARVSGTQQAVEHAGRDNELEYQELLYGLALKRDMETILLRNQGRSSGAPGTPRALGAVLSWIYTNTDKGTTGSDPSSAQLGISTRTDGTMRAFTEAQLKTVLAAAWGNGGNPDTIMTGSFNKQQFSTFVGRSTPMEEAKTKKIVATVDVYESDFGKLNVVANRFQRARDVLVLEMDKWAVSYLSGRQFVSIPLARTGDSERRQIVSEYTLTARAPIANGGVFDVTSA